MIEQHTYSIAPSPGPSDFDKSRLSAAGRQAAEAMSPVTATQTMLPELRKRTRKLEKSVAVLLHSAALEEAGGRWLFENYRLVRTALKETRDIALSFSDYPAVRFGKDDELPRAYAVARAYLGATLDQFTEETLTAFLAGFQELQELQMGEVWALKPALQLVLLERLAVARDQVGASVPVVVSSLRAVAESGWKDLFETVNIVDRVLARDPAGSYSDMDYESRDYYRNRLAELSKHSSFSEREVAETAIRLASGAKWVRQSHAGYWLIDRGRGELRAAIGYRAPLQQRIRDFILKNATAYYLIGIEIMIFVIVVALIEGLAEYTPFVAAFFLLLLPASQAAVDFMNNLTSYLAPPRVLPKLDFSESVPAEFATMVAVPTLLLNARQVRQLAADLEIRFLANRDSNLYFALITDSPDSDQPEDEKDELTSVCVSLVEDLNRRYGSDSYSPFYLFHRHRVFNPSEGRWMGWERKRGKLLDLNQLMRGGFDSFPVKVGDMSVLPRIKYVITLDSDTQLPRDAARRLIGAIAHPLNRAVVDPVTRMVVAGYGILQPRIGVSIQSASASRLASIYSGQTGFDIYTRAVSDVYQDLFGEGSFTGKGIYDIDALRDSLEHRFPENALLSHDLIEGAYARAGLVSDIELIDDYPSHFSAYSRRKHRWVRGDWQIMRWMLPTVPDYNKQIIPNPIHLISRWKILDNLRRSLLEPATLALLLGGWIFLKGGPWYWTMATVGLMLTPVYAGLLFSVLRAPMGGARRAWLAWAKDTGSAFAQGHFVVMLQIVFLLHQAMLSIDAIVRSILRVFFTKRMLLQWETAAEAQSAVRKKSTVDVYLSWSPLLAGAIAGLVWLLRPEALPVAAPILLLWLFARNISDWLNRAPRTGRRRLSEGDVAFLRAAAARTWLYFRDFCSAESNWLIPDNAREDGAVAQRLSPTNLGFLLNARVAAVHLGYLSVPEFVRETQCTLGAVRELRKFRGHVWNWYSNETLQPLQPYFVSTVDSGNLAACLWTVKQAALAFADHAPGEEAIRAGRRDMEELGLGDEIPVRGPGDTEVTGEVKSLLHEIAAECDRLVNEMDFRFLFHRRKKVMSVGWDVDTNRLEPSSYDLLASESRIASFVAIAKGDVPQEAWFHLGRKHTLAAGQRVLVSWTGTMFEYLMPAIWMHQFRNTIMQDSMEAAVRVQQRAARSKGMPWGISESGCAGEPGCDYGYSAFGIPELAMKRLSAQPMVVSPYSTFLSLLVDPRAAMKNLRRMTQQGWVGKYGFYEAIDYRGGAPEVVRSWMAHHQGMSLLAISNVLFENVMQRYFHAEPQVLSTELLLTERVPGMVTIDSEEPPARPALVKEQAA